MWLGILPTHLVLFDHLTVVCYFPHLWKVLNTSKLYIVFQSKICCIYDFGDSWLCCSNVCSFLSISVLVCFPSPLSLSLQFMRVPRSPLTPSFPSAQGPVTFRVQVPNLPERPEWKMSGQLITMTLPITDPVSPLKTYENFCDVASCLWQVSVIKAKISTEFGMPSGKQKLQIGVCARALLCLYKSVSPPRDSVVQVYYLCLF